LLLALGIASCAQRRESAGPNYGDEPDEIVEPRYSFAIHPLHNPQKLMEAYQPLIDLMNSSIAGSRFTLEASRDYASYEDKYRARKPALLLPNPWETLQAMKAGYRVVAMAGDPSDFRGLIIVRVDGGIESPQDLKGKAVSYPARTALAACIMPQYYLQEFGIDVAKDIENRYVGSQESSILNVLHKLTAAGATWPPPWRAFQKNHPVEAARLRVAWETESLVNNSVMIRDDVPADIEEKLRAILFGLHETERGRSILEGMETSRFLPATDEDYDVIRSYIERFEREVRKVESG
ncbi:MAG: PhnD/SsuA/transferrin family substrate-binding protein, partial [Spirochaetaceae bacterium]|nr:PhnD/SsuA/transferrin family substrate-binding protein [Spirochaetaceae bacterium]